MMQFNVIDFEASSLALPHSYPISVGVSMADGRSYHAYIKPCVDEWTDWNETSEAIHNIPRKLLWDIGKDPHTIALELNEFIGMNTIVCDGGLYDVHWCNQLYDAANANRSWPICDVGVVMSEMGFPKWEHAKYRICKYDVTQTMAELKEHDALNDAIIIQMALQNLYETTNRKPND